MTEKEARQKAEEKQDMVKQRAIRQRDTPTEPAFPILSIEPFMKKEAEWDVKIELQHKDVIYDDLFGKSPIYDVV